MAYTQEQLQMFAAACGIPTQQKDLRVWIVRTEGGSFYENFSRNGYVALGWDNIPLARIQNKDRKRDEEIAYIRNEYPNETRPGLVYSQLVAFVWTMKAGDCVIIPSKGSNYVYIGTLGDLYERTDAQQELFGDEYTRCEYRLRRHVTWAKEASIQDDIYLTRTLRSHQTIADVSQYADLIYRNLFDFYYIDGKLSLTLRKQTNTDVSFIDELSLTNEIAEIVSLVTKTLNAKETPTIIKRTAMGSPGFLELLVPVVGTPLAITIFVFLFRTLGGKIKGTDGIEIKGIPALLQSISNLFNDKAARANTSAQTERLKAETRKLDVETELAKEEVVHKRLENMRDYFTITNGMGIDDEELQKSNVRLISDLEERQKRIAPIMQRLGMQAPVIQAGSNILPFTCPKGNESDNDSD